MISIEVWGDEDDVTPAMRACLLARIEGVLPVDPVADRRSPVILATHVRAAEGRNVASSPTRGSVDPDTPFRCESQKYSFETREAALEGAESQMDRGAVRPGCHITPYQCDECGRFHLTNRIIVHLGRGQKAWS